MRCQRILFLTACTLLLAISTPVTRAAELAEKGRDVFKKYQQAVVTVQVVLKVTGTRGGSSEYNLDITGTVIDPSGLTVLALSACDPYELRRRISSDVRVESEVSSVKFLLNDGSDLMADVVLRDRDLDLAFLRPKTKPANPMTAVDLANSAPAQVLDDVISLNRLNRASSRAYAASIEHICAVVQKPRTFYIPDSSMTATSSGSPAFHPDGKILGVFVMRAVPGTDSREGVVSSIILPAEDILKAAKQAPEVKGDSEKKEEPKVEKKP